MELNENSSVFWAVAVALVTTLFIVIILLGRSQSPPDDVPDCDPSEVLVLDGQPSPVCLEPSNQ